MVRATRSTQIALEAPEPVIAETTTTPSPTAAAKKGPSRKRKRASTTDDGDQNDASGHDGESHSMDDVDEEMKGDVREAKEERRAEKKQRTKSLIPDEFATPEPPRSIHRDAGELSLTTHDAESLRSALEGLEVDNMMDREVNIPVEQSPSTSTSVSVSLHKILRQPESYPIRSIRRAIQLLVPTNPVPRGLPNSAFTQQKQFCTIALSLLDHIVTRQPGAIDLSRSNLDHDGTRLADGKMAKVKYALHQHLPSGDFFSSLASLTLQEAADMSTGQGSLVAIQPSIAIPSQSMSKLSAYARKPKPLVTPASRLPSTRRMAPGSCLDYGAYSSFAPTFDSESGELDENDMASYIWERQQKKTRREASHRAFEAVATEDIVMVDEEPQTASSSQSSGPSKASGERSAEISATSIDPALEMEDDLRAAMAQLAFESDIDELLKKNALALQRLSQLQTERYSMGEKAPPVEEGCEEWRIAHEILASLTTLTALRPRLDGSSTSTIIPPTSILRTLHRTLPIDPIPGWKGTLARGKDGAYRDNNTITVGATPYVDPTPATPAPAPKPQAPVQQQQQPVAPPQYYQNYARPGMTTAQPSYYQQYYAQQYAATAGKQPAQYYYPSYAGYAGYQGYPAVQTPTYPQTPGAVATPSTPVSRAIPNMAKPAVATAPAWGTPVNAGAALPPHLRTGVVTPGAYGAAPVYPPMQTYASGYGTPTAASFPAQKV